MDANVVYRIMKLITLLEEQAVQSPTVATASNTGTTATNTGTTASNTALIAGNTAAVASDTTDLVTSCAAIQGSTASADTTLSTLLTLSQTLNQSLRGSNASNRRLLTDNQRSFFTSDTNAFHCQSSVMFYVRMHSRLGIWATLNSGTVDIPGLSAGNANYLRIQTSTAANSMAAYYTKDFVSAVAGCAAMCRFSVVFSSPSATDSGTAQEIGLMSKNYYNYTFGYRGTSFGVFIGQGTVAQSFVSQANWNTDKCNGTGPSGFTLNPLMGNEYQVKCHPSGFGAVTYWVMDASTCDYILVHVLSQANTSSAALTGSMHYNMYVHCENGSTGGTAVYIYSKLLSLGYDKPPPILNNWIHYGFFGGTYVNLATVDFVPNHVMTIFNPSVNAVGLVPNGVKVKIIHLRLLFETSGREVGLQLLLNATIATNNTDYTRPYDTGTAGIRAETTTSIEVIEPGETLFATRISTSLDYEQDFTNFNIILYPGDKLTVAVSRQVDTAWSNKIATAISWAESFQ